MDLNDPHFKKLKEKFMNDIKTGNANVDDYISNLNKLDISLAEEILCEACESNQFRMFVYLKRIPEVSSPTGKPVIIPMQAYICRKCEHVNKEFMLKEV